MDLEEKLITLISETLGTEERNISLESDFYKDLNANKFEVADLIAACQQKFDIPLNEEIINRIQTVGDLLKLLEENSDEI
jgi:acyl carrier protein